VHPGGAGWSGCGGGWRVAVLALLGCATGPQAEVLQLPGGVTMIVTMVCEKSIICQAGSELIGEKMPRTATALCVSGENV